MDLRRIRLRYMALWLLVQTAVVVTVVAFLAGLPVIQWSLIGFVLGLGQAVTIVLVWKMGRREMEARGYRW